MENLVPHPMEIESASLKIWPRIISIGCANPENRYSQDEIYNLIGYNDEKYRKIFLNSGVFHRYLFIPKHGFTFDETADELHERYKKGGLSLGRQAIENCLRKLDIVPREIDLMIVVSSTGYLCPGLSYLLARELNMRNEFQSVNISGAACSGAFAGMRTALDHLKSYPDHMVILLVVEICSAAYFIDDTYETVIGNAIGADGAAAFLITNNKCKSGPMIIAFESLLKSDCIDHMNFSIVDGRLRVTLSKKIPDIVKSLAEEVVLNLLKKNNLKKGDIKYWIFHPGSRKIVDNIQEVFMLNKEEVKYSRAVLANYGNMASATVMFVLDELLKNECPMKDDLGIMLVVGPGFEAGVILMKW